ncbi:MAG: serine protease [Sphingomonas sp.]|uniref:Serine protease n=3 Tax=Sphingomonadaceae TaxID=41297 RepID=A0A2A4I894_9SPHN|nr:serine protease [Sphingomonas adhaesiva]PZU82044.1 MAG: serine protease [Sphingomonas sp.]
MAAMRPKRHAARLFAFLLPMIAAACTGDAGPPRVVEPRPDAPAPARGESVLRRAMLAGHNASRAAVGVAPLVWDDALERSAAAYAKELARTGRFAHAEQPQGPGREGENLFTGTRGAYGYDEMVALWVAEKSDFVNRPVPESSRSGNWGGVAHYVQIVWRGSGRVGCAVASSRSDDYLVCRYSPAGNVMGERAF